MLWASYFSSCKNLLDSLKEKYDLLSDSLKFGTDNTKWQEALNIFNSRFGVPFRMEIANLRKSIIGEGVPHAVFCFDSPDGKHVRKERTELTEMDTLSQGEKRALYLLNIIFDIEKLKADGREKLVIIDDIADSFDYKNKYAIIEYLYELSKEPWCYMVILSHNFDFYRTVSSRLDSSRCNHLFAYPDNGTIRFKQEKYQKIAFQAWRDNVTPKTMLAMIPFVRNIIEYTHGEDGQEYKDLTALLHIKTQSSSLTFSDVEKIYNKYLVCNLMNVNPKLKVLPELFQTCNNIVGDESKFDLDDKIILAIGIRLKAEEYMIKELKASGNGSVINSISSNQTRTLHKHVKSLCKLSNEKQKILEEVNIITPEHIHFNSFMYEPIIDLDIIELERLYSKVCAL